MKKYLFIISVIILSVSCKDMFNLAPPDQIASGNMWTSESLADAGMVGLYRNFYPETETTDNVYLQSGFSGFNRQIWMSLEPQSQMRLNRGTSVLSAATKSAGSYYCIEYEWEWHYTGIHRINDAIENLSKAPLSTEKYERYLCEAKFLRAWYYSRLNMIYQGVPLYLEVVSNENCTKGQSTSAEVWDAVIKDLTDCIECENFPDNTLSSNYGRPSRGAAYSLRGLAYMYLAWENGEDNSYYQLAADDFEKVSECGYGLWAGEYIDFFNYENEKDHEMIFPIQFTGDVGYRDYMQILLGNRDCYNGWAEMYCSFDFVNLYQNADGSKFNYADIIPEWYDDVFENDYSKREVFFVRNSVHLGSDGKVLKESWDESQQGQLQEVVDRIGLDLFEKYYLPEGNEERVRELYNNRDPRLKQTIITPYDPFDTYVPGYNGDENMVGKEMRWPYISDSHKSYDDLYVGGEPTRAFLYKKYVYHLKGEMSDRLNGPTDWPLIRYTDVYLHLAECYVHLGRLSEAASIVNEIRARAHMPSITVGSADDVMEAVRYERRVELCLEGHVYFDEWRWGTYKDTKFQGRDIYGSQSFWGEWDGFYVTWYYTDYMYPWAMPASECEKNPNLTRTPGWAY